MIEFEMVKLACEFGVVFMGDYLFETFDKSRQN